MGAPSQSAVRSMRPTAPRPPDFDPLRIVGTETRIEDLGLDDAANLQFRQALEARLGAKLPDDALDQSKTVGDLVAHIHKAL